jgi:hypothetical protein
MLMHCFDSHVTRQKMKKRKYIVANATNKQAKIYDNQLKQTGVGHYKRDAIGANCFVGISPVIWERN